MQENSVLSGLIAAPFTPFSADGKSVELNSIRKYSELLSNSGVGGAFICGTTGEGMSMTVNERLAVAEQWQSVAPSELKIIVHVGHTSLSDAVNLAGHAADIGACGVGCMAPSFFRPETVNDLVDFLAEVAAAAPELPFYYYHMPAMTGVTFKALDFLAAASDKIPNLRGIKFTDEDLMDMQLCRTFDNGRFDILAGRDELLICGLTLGCTGAVGSTYNFMAPLYTELWDRFKRGDNSGANKLQVIAMQIIRILFKYGNPMTCGKAIMRRIGIDCGTLRLPLCPLDATAEQLLMCELDRLDFSSFACSLGE